MRSHWAGMGVGGTRGQKPQDCSAFPQHPSPNSPIPVTLKVKFLTVECGRTPSDASRGVALSEGQTQAQRSLLPMWLRESQRG